MKKLKQFLTQTSTASKVVLFAAKITVLFIVIKLIFWLKNYPHALAFMTGLLIGLILISIIDYVRKQ